MKDWSSDNAIFPVGGVNYSAKIKRHFPFDIALKFGLPIDNALPYIRFGFAQSSYKWNLSSTTTDDVYKATDKRSDLIAGLGVDFLASPCVVVGVGYDLTLSNKRKTVIYDKDNDGAIKSKHRAHTFLVKFAYKIG